MAFQTVEDNGAETHDDVDRFIRMEAGTGKAMLDGNEVDLADGSVVVVPAGAAHNIVNTSTSAPLKLYLHHLLPA